MKKIIWLVVVVVLIGGLFLMRREKDEDQPIKIGIASLMTGDFSVVGENVRDTANLFIDDINSKGGINGKKIELVIEDSKCDSKTGLSAVSKLVNIDKVKYIIGAMCSNGTIASAPVVNENKVILLTPVTGGQNVDNAGEYVFRTANSDVLAGVDIANAMVKMGYKKVGLVTEITEANQDVKKGFVGQFTKLGGSVLIEEDFQPGMTDFRTLVTKIKSTGVQAVTIWSQTGISGAHFVKQLKEQNLEIPIFSDFNFVLNPDAKKIAGNFNGIYFADPEYNSENSELKNFFSRFEERYKHSPVIPFHTAGTYDAISLILNAIKEEGDNSEKVKNWLLKNVKNYSGFMGTYSLDEKGNSDLGFVIKQIQNDIPVVVK